MVLDGRTALTSMGIRWVTERRVITVLPFALANLILAALALPSLPGRSSSICASFQNARGEFSFLTITISPGEIEFVEPFEFDFTDCSRRLVMYSFRHCFVSCSKSRLWCRDLRVSDLFVLTTSWC